MRSVTYSALLSESSLHHSGERRVRSISPGVREKLLQEHRIVVAIDQTPDSVFAALLQKALSLPTGTIFTVGNLVQSPTPLFASKLGRLWKAHVANSCDFEHIGIKLTRGIYKRLDTQRELVAHIQINFKDEQND